jgi:hypothetical protein
VRLTTTRLLLAGFTLTIVVVVGALVLLHEREPPEDPKAPPTGPSSVIRGVMKRAAARADAERRNQALGIEQALHDAGSD